MTDEPTPEIDPTDDELDALVVETDVPTPDSPPPAKPQQENQP